ncbi:MAG: DeoR/GlpR transcriptional regulator [Anaerolineae bacterium]|jgi:DeoR/GlpR family transcriptional regulator of sugar metabolism|nr:MAG: DeoR/GlpR transcriptional regulator [Anaerolineae bacterium]
MSGYLSEERHQIILETLEARGSVTVNEMVERFGVSEMTIRRDLDALERRGLLRRVHGGAVLDRGRSYEPPFVARSVENLAAKQQIARAAVALIENGDSIILDVGTTTLEIARQLVDKQNLTVITPCLQIATLLAENPNIRLILTGGIVRPTELSMVGHLAERALRDFYVDKLFLGAAGVDLEAGLTEYNLEDTLVKQVMIKNAKRVILVADSSKFGRIAFTAIAPINVINTLITDHSLDPDWVKRLEKLDIEVILCGATPNE